MKWWVLLTNSIVVMMLAFSTTGIITALPIMQEQLNLTPVMARWVVNGYIAATATFIMLGGCLGDRWGHFRLFFFGNVLFTAMGLLITFTSSGALIVVARVLQGFAAAFVSALSLSSISIAFPKSGRALAVSIWGGIVALGFGLGPLVGGLVTTYLSWRHLFFFISLVTLIGTICNAIFWIYYPKRHGEGTIDIWSISLLIFTIAPLIYWLMEGENLGWFSPISWILIAFAIAMFVTFIVRVSRSDEAQFLTNKMLMGCNIIFFVTAFSIISFLFFYNRFMQWPLIHDATPLEAAKWIFPANLTMFATALISSPLGRKIGFRYVLASGLAAIVTGFLFMALLPMQQANGWHVVALLILGMGFGLTFPVVPHVGLSSLPDAQQGKGSGILNTVNYLGGSFAIAVGSLIYLKMATPTLSYLDGHTIDKLLLGSREEVLDWLGAAESVVELQQAAMTSFTYLLLAAAALAACGLLSTGLLRKN